MLHNSKSRSMSSRSVAAVLLLACAAVASAQKMYQCGVQYEVAGDVIRSAMTTSAAACQTSCQNTPGCIIFMVFEDVNNPQVNSCTLMGRPAGTGKRNLAVIAVCAADADTWKAMAVPADFQASTGTFVPLNFGLSGAYAPAAYSGGVVGIHVTMVPNSNLVLLYGRPQSEDYPPQPGMANPKFPTRPWPASVVDYTTGRFQAVPSYSGAPFCAHAIHMSNDDILSCGGDDDYIATDGGWGGAKGCRIFTQKGGAQWLRSLTLADGHWYPTILELPPGTGGSKGTCALILGGTTKNGGRGTTTVEIVCPTDNVRMSQLVSKMGLANSVRRVLTNWYPTSFLLPQNSPTDPPRIVVNADGGGQVMTLVMTMKSFKLVPFKNLPGVPNYFPSNKYLMPPAAVLLAVDLSAGVVDKNLEYVFFGGASPSGTTASPNAFRIKPLSDNPTWEVETMPSPATMRVMVVLPNGRMILVNGGKYGFPGGGAGCCSSSASQPITQAWEYDPYKPNGQRFWVDPVLNTHFRL